MINLDDLVPLEAFPVGDRVSYRARSSGTDVTLLVHLYRNAAAAEGELIASRLSRFPPEERARILDFSRERRQIFFITTDLPGDRTFSQWTHSLLDEPARGASPAPPPGAPPQTAPASPPPEPGEFTEFWSGRRAARAAPAERPQPVQEPAPRANDPNDTRGTNTSEEFDRHYGMGKPAPAASGDVAARGAMDFYIPASTTSGIDRPEVRRPSQPPSVYPTPLAGGAQRNFPKPATVAWERGTPEADRENTPFASRWELWLLTVGIILAAALIVIVICNLLGLT